MSGGLLARARSHAHRHGWMWRSQAKLFAEVDDQAHDAEDLAAYERDGASPREASLMLACAAAAVDGAEVGRGRRGT